MQLYHPYKALFLLVDFDGLDEANTLFPTRCLNIKSLLCISKFLVNKKLVSGLQDSYQVTIFADRIDHFFHQL